MEELLIKVKSFINLDTFLLINGLNKLILVLCIRLWKFFYMSFEMTGLGLYINNKLNIRIIYNKIHINIFHY